MWHLPKNENHSSSNRMWKYFWFDKKNISSLLDQLNLQVTNLIQLENEATHLRNSKQAHFYQEYIVPKMNELRFIVDTLETIVSKEYWPVPSYTDLLFNE